MPRRPITSAISPDFTVILLADILHGDYNTTNLFGKEVYIIMAKYIEAELEIIAFDAEDVITTSCTGIDGGCAGMND